MVPYKWYFALEGLRGLAEPPGLQIRLDNFHQVVCSGLGLALGVLLQLEAKKLKVKWTVWKESQITKKTKKGTHLRAAIALHSKTLL